MFYGLFANSKDKLVQAIYDRHIMLTHIGIQKKDIKRRIAELDRELKRMDDNYKKRIESSNKSISEEKETKNILIYV